MLKKSSTIEIVGENAKRWLGDFKKLFQNDH